MSLEMYEGMSKADLMPLLVQELNALDKLEDSKEKAVAEWKDKIKEQELHISGIRWGDMDSNWTAWTPEQYRDALISHPVASHGFLSDFRAMQWADTCVLLLPSGRSAHLEAGWMAGAGKRTVVLLAPGQDPELMNLLLDDICVSVDELLKVLVEGATAKQGLP